MTPDDHPPTNITELLRKWGEGDQAALDELLPSVYDELKLQAARYLRRERPNHTLQTTALVHEAYLKMVDQRKVDWKNRGHFFAIAAQAMRRILVDHARRRKRTKRGGASDDDQLDETLTIAEEDGGLDVEALDEALTELARRDPRAGQIVELRFFAGLNVKETSDILEISESTVTREWQAARAWLFREMSRN